VPDTFVGVQPVDIDEVYPAEHGLREIVYRALRLDDTVAETRHPPVEVLLNRRHVRRGRQVIDVVPGQPRVDAVYPVDRASIEESLRALAAVRPDLKQRELPLSDRRDELRKRRPVPDRHVDKVSH
jgi:hypothetical protein